MVEVQKINPTWDSHCIVAASGPSLKPDVIHTVRMARITDQWNVIAVNDVYKVMPWADAMYAVDNRWWSVHKDCPGFKGKKWAGHSSTPDDGNDKRPFAEEFGINLISGKCGDTFSSDPGLIHYGLNSGFQAINLAILHGATYIVLVGFDMRHVNGKAHFFGDHPPELTNSGDHNYRAHVTPFNTAAKALSKTIRIVNATPGSAIQCFPIMDLEAAIDRKEIDRHSGVYRDRTEPHACAG